MTSPDKPQCPCGFGELHSDGCRFSCDYDHTICLRMIAEAQGHGGQAGPMPSHYIYTGIPGKSEDTPPTSFAAEVWELLCGQKLHMEPGKSPVIVDTEKTLAAITRAVEKHVIGEDDPKPILEDDPDAAAGVLTATGLRNAIRSSQFDWRAYAERTNLRAEQRRHLHE